jgi:lipopolysaccharide biosynthesis glycosyltransferase
LAAHVEKSNNGTGGLSFSIEFLNVEQYVKNFEFYKNPVPLLPSFYKLLLPYLLPKEYETILLLDCDMIVQKDIAEIFETNLDGYLLGAALDTVFQRIYPGLYKTVRTEPGDKIYEISQMKKPENYINSGMLLFNSAAFRAAFTIEDLFRNAHKSTLPEQDVLNILCEGKILIMHPRYNFQIFERWGDRPSAAVVTEKHAREYNEAREAPVVIHFLQKPWNDIYNTYYGVYFFGYASRTPFFETILERMRKRDLLCCISGLDASKNLLLLFKQKKYRQLLKCGSCAMLRGFYSIGKKLFAVKGD